MPSDSGRSSYRFSAIVPCVLGACSAYALCTDAVYRPISTSLIWFAHILPGDAGAWILNGNPIAWSLCFAFLAGSAANLVVGAVGAVGEAVWPQAGGASKLASEVAQRDATIRELSTELSSYARAIGEWQVHGQTLAEKLADSEQQRTELASERNQLALDLGQARAAIARGAALPPKFVDLFRDTVVIKTFKVGLHPDRAKSEFERRQREQLTKSFLEFVDYCARQAADEKVSKTG